MKSTESGLFINQLKIYKNVTFLRLFVIYLMPINIVFGTLILVKNISETIELITNTYYAPIFQIILWANCLIMAILISLFILARQDLIRFKRSGITKILIITSINAFYCLIYTILLFANPDDKEIASTFTSSFTTSIVQFIIMIYLVKRSYIFTNGVRKNSKTIKTAQDMARESLDKLTIQENKLLNVKNKRIVLSSLVSIVLIISITTFFFINHNNKNIATTERVIEQMRDVQDCLIETKYQTAFIYIKVNEKKSTYTFLNDNYDNIKDLVLNRDIFGIKYIEIIAN